MLLLTDAEGDPLILQIKEARASVLENYAGKSVYPNHGERVVNGHRLMQPASDIFLGWTEGGMEDVTTMSASCGTSKSSFPSRRTTSRG